jgi:hypothetical protein
LQEIVKESQQIATVQKSDVFATELTKEEQEIIRQRVLAQQRQYQSYEQRENTKRIKKIKTVHPYVTDEEALQALKESAEDEVMNSSNVFGSLIYIVLLYYYRKKHAYF